MRVNEGASRLVKIDLSHPRRRRLVYFAAVQQLAADNLEVAPSTNLRHGHQESFHLDLYEPTLEVTLTNAARVLRRDAVALASRVLNLDSPLLPEPRDTHVIISLLRGPDIRYPQAMYRSIDVSTIDSEPNFHVRVIPLRQDTNTDPGIGTEEYFFDWVARPFGVEGAAVKGWRDGIASACLAASLGYAQEELRIKFPSDYLNSFGDDSQESASLVLHP